MNGLINTVNWEIVSQWGFGVLIFLAFMFLLKWVLKQQEKILDNAREERVSWQEMVRQFNDEIKEHTASAKEFHNQVFEAHKYQREEHKDMVNILVKVTAGVEAVHSSILSGIENFKINHEQRSAENRAILETTKSMTQNCVECSKTLAHINDNVGK